MLKGALARRYAQALFEVALNDSLDRIEQELKAVTQITREEEVNQVLNHPHISAANKKSVMDKVMGDQWGETVRNFLFLLIDRRRQDILPFVQQEFSKMADGKRQIVEAKLASAKVLNADQEERLKQTLEKKTGKQVRIVKELRPELIGGVLIQIGDQVIDGTVAYALKRMREELQKDSEYEPQEVGVN